MFRLYVSGLVLWMGRQRRYPGASDGLPVTETELSGREFVKEGDVLFEIDPRPSSRLAEAKRT